MCKCRLYMASWLERVERQLATVDLSAAAARTLCTERRVLLALLAATTNLGRDKRNG